MLFNLLKFTVCFLFVSSFASANEGGGGESAHGGGGAATATGSVVSPQYSGKQNQDWAEIQTKLATLKAKLDAQEAVVKSLMGSSSHGSSSHQAPSGGEHGAPPAAGHGGAGASSANVNSSEVLKAEHKKWQDLILEYNTVQHEYETRYPEKGVKELRVYKRIEPSEIEDTQKEMTLEGRVNQLHQKIVKQYRPAIEPVVKPKKIKKNDSIKSEKGDEKLSLPKKNKTEPSVTDQIILQK